MKNKLSTQIILNAWPSQFDGHLNYCIGLSGGIDSIVLLDLFSKIRKIKEFNLSAIHVNHNLSPNAENWQQFCIDICNKYDIPLIAKSVNIKKIAGQGLENSARIIRYQEYAQTDANVIILAHHQDDQIETMLSQIMRGSNLHNSAGMLSIKKRAQQTFWRPLLNIPKSSICDYAQENQLVHIEDESNKNNVFLRNFIRNQILPELEQFDIDVKNKLSKTVQELQYLTALGDELAILDYQNTLEQNLKSLSRQKFIQLSPLRQQNLLTYYIQQQNIALPSQKRIVEFLRQTKTFSNGRKPQLKLSESSCIESTFKLITITQNKSLDK